MLDMTTLPDATTLLLGLVFSSIGLGYFMYGKRRADLLLKYSGVGLMVCPYFIESKAALVVVGILLMVVPWVVEV